MCVFESYGFLVRNSAYANEAKKDFGILAGPTCIFQRSHILERGRNVATSSNRPSRPSSSTSYHRYNSVSITIAEPRPGPRLSYNTILKSKAHLGRSIRAVETTAAGLRHVGAHLPFRAGWTASCMVTAIHTTILYLCSAGKYKLCVLFAPFIEQSLKAFCHLVEVSILSHDITKPAVIRHPSSLYYFSSQTSFQPCV